MKKKLIFVLITEHGKGIYFINELKKIGINQGFALRGEGTVKSEILKLLDIDYSTKDLIFCALNDDEEEKVYQLLHSKNTFIANCSGIAFSVPLENNMSNELKQSVAEILILIMDENKRRKALEIARANDVIGGTIVSGRGAGIPKEYYFPIMVEPEKSIFLFVMTHEDSKRLREVFVEKLKLNDPGQGMIFVLPVSKAYGIKGMD